MSTSVLGTPPTSQIMNLSGSALVHWLRRRGRLLPLLREAVIEELCVQAASDAGLSTTPVELQQVANRFRLQKGLASSETTHRWLREQQISVEEWEIALERDLLIEKFKDHLAATDAADYFAANQEQYARVRLQRLTVASEGLARELLTQIIEEGRSFEEIAARGSSDPTGGDLGEVCRGQLPASVADLVFAAKSGDVVGPFPGPRGFELYHVGNSRTPELDPTTLGIIRNDLFIAWIRNRMVGIIISLDELAEE